MFYVSVVLFQFTYGYPHNGFTSKLQDYDNVTKNDPFYLWKSVCVCRDSGSFRVDSHVQYYKLIKCELNKHFPNGYRGYRGH